MRIFFFFQAEDGIRDHCVTGVQTCALPISPRHLVSTVPRDLEIICLKCLRKDRSEEHTSELQSHSDLVCRLLLEKKKCGAVRLRLQSHVALCRTAVVRSRGVFRYGQLRDRVDDEELAPRRVFRFFFNDTATTEIYTLSLHDALPICQPGPQHLRLLHGGTRRRRRHDHRPDRKSTRLNSSHTVISYAVFCLKKKK